MWKLLVALLVAWAGWRLWKNALGYRPKTAARPIPRYDEAEACAILGVAPGADVATIRAAHRRLMADAHPDRGGSPERARALNAARDLLLARPG